MEESDFQAVIGAATTIATSPLDHEGERGIDSKTRDCARTFLCWVFDNYGVGEHEEPHGEEEETAQAD